MANFLGWVGALCFAFSAVPQAYQCYRQKHADGMSWGFLILWLSGELCMIVYSVSERNIILLTNYGINLVLLLVIAYYKVYGDNNGQIQSKSSRRSYSEII